MNLRGVHGNVDGERRKKEKLLSHQWTMKKSVESGRCIGVEMGQKIGINSKKEMMGNQMKVVRKKKKINDEQRILVQQGKLYHP